MHTLRPHDPLIAFLGSAYGNAFVFAGPGGVQAVKRDDFLKMVPKRAAFFRSLLKNGCSPI
jgi:hypothetical protein